MRNPSCLKENSPGIYRLYALFFLCLINGVTLAVDRNYSFGSIPSGRLENSNTVIRFQETTLEIKSAGKAAMKVNYALTVLNATATDNAILVVFYNKFTKIRHLK